MKVLIYITIACFFLKWSGLMKKFLDRLKLPEAAEAPEVDEKPTRQQLEAHAIYILESRGLSTDYVKYMTDKLLIEIIKEYYTDR